MSDDPRAIPVRLTAEGRVVPVQPIVGERRLVVIVRCDCDDRWWAQPEGGYFPLCQQCGSEARPDGAPRTTSQSHRLVTDEDLRAEERRLAERREHAVGGILTVMMERDAIGEPRDG